MEFLRRVGDALGSAKDFTAQHYINKELGKRKNTGARGQGTFGGSAPTPRMAGNAAVGAIAGELIKNGVDDHLMPAMNRKFDEFQKNRTLNKHQEKGGRLMIPATTNL
tara:strand:- start:61 stop:384 length:324 start_codon:yes stop_codon:yes gene_type:complete